MIIKLPNEQKAYRYPDNSIYGKIGNIIRIISTVVPGYTYIEFTFPKDNHPKDYRYGKYILNIYVKIIQSNFRLYLNKIKN